MTEAPAPTSPSAADGGTPATGHATECPVPDFSVSIDLPESGSDDLLQPLPNSHYDQPSGTWGNIRDSKVKFDIEIDSDDDSFVADQTEIVVQRGANVIFSETFTSDKVAKGDHEWLWDGYDYNGVLNSTILKGEGLNVTVEVSKGGVTKSAVENLDNEPEQVEWLDIRIETAPSNIQIDVYVNYQNEDSMPAADFTRLKGLVAAGINLYWSRDITINGTVYHVTTNVIERQERSIDLDLYLETDSDYSRSHASGIIDTTLYYNQGFYGGNNTNADTNFKNVAAHEFGHTVLEESLGRGHSWGHKGTTNPILQTALSSAPSYPATGEIDLMYYYNGNQPTDYYTRTKAVEEDIKKLIWLTQIDFDED